MTKKKVKPEPELDLQDELNELFLLRKEKKTIEEKIVKASDNCLKLLKADDCATILIEGVNYEARHEEVETPVINPDIDWVKKRAGEFFDKIIQVSISLAREVGGEDLIKKLKIGTNTSHRIKFYKLKETK